MAHHEAIDKVMKQRDLGGEIRRVPGGSLTQADDALVGVELDEQPQPTAAIGRVLFRRMVSTPVTFLWLLPSIQTFVARVG